MKESCFCGRTGEIAERKLLVDGDGEQALQCPNVLCGHLDYLRWLSDDSRLSILEEAAERTRHEQLVIAAQPGM